MAHQLKDVFVGAWVEPRTKDSLRRLAELRGVSQSKILRILIDEAHTRATDAIAGISPSESNGHTPQPTK